MILYNYIKTTRNLENTMINLSRIFGLVELSKQETSLFVDKHARYLLHTCKFCINTISYFHLIKDDKRRDKFVNGK